MRRVTGQMWRGGRAASALAALAVLGLVGGCTATDPAPSPSADEQREVIPRATPSSVADTVSATSEAAAPEALPSDAPSSTAPRPPETPSGSDSPEADPTTAREPADDLPSSASTTTGPRTPTAASQGSESQGSESQGSESQGSALSIPEQGDLAEASLQDAFEAGEGVLGAPLPAPDSDEEAAAEGPDDEDQRIDTEGFADVAAGAYLAQLESQAQQYESEGLKQVGAPRILSVTPVTLPDVPSDADRIVADVCVDSSQVQVLDAEGVDHRADQPSDPTLFRYTFALEDGSWRIVEETFPDEFTC